jgi:alkanesulfonate monooxygenase SsuD/methylene tetrahydromethanopterin reductase-like flavin-dependent oxidoreductase (luciferase family)
VARCGFTAWREGGRRALELNGVGLKDTIALGIHRWFSTVYHNPDGTDASGVHGTPEQVRAKLEELVAMGANHLLLNPVCRYAEQVEALAAIVGLPEKRASP